MTTEEFELKPKESVSQVKQESSERFDNSLHSQVKLLQQKNEQFKELAERLNKTGELAELRIDGIEKRQEKNIESSRPDSILEITSYGDEKVKLADGTIVASWAVTGARTAYAPNGDAVTVRKDGSTTVELEAGTSVCVLPTQIASIEYVSGTKSMLGNDGSKFTLKPDGSTVLQNNDGVTFTCLVNGISITEESGKPRLVVLPDGKAFELPAASASSEPHDSGASKQHGGSDSDPLSKISNYIEDIKSAVQQSLESKSGADGSAISLLLKELKSAVPDEPAVTGLSERDMLQLLNKSIPDAARDSAGSSGDLRLVGSEHVPSEKPMGSLYDKAASDKVMRLEDGRIADFRPISPENLRELPLAELRQAMDRNMQALLQVAEKNLDKMPFLGFHGTKAEGLPGIQKEGFHGYLYGFKERPTDAATLVSDIAQSAGRALKYATQDWKEGTAAGGVLVFDASTKTTQGLGKRVEGTLAGHDQDHPLMPKTGSISEWVGKVEPKDFNSKLVGILDPKQFAHFDVSFKGNDADERNSIAGALKLQALTYEIFNKLGLVSKDVAKEGRTDAIQLGKEFVRAQGPIDTADAMENLLAAGRSSPMAAKVLKELGVDVENKKQVEQLKETLGKARDGEGDIDAINALKALQGKLLPILDSQAREQAIEAAKAGGRPEPIRYELVSRPGVTRTENEDGSIVDTNAKGDVIRVKNAQERESEFVYGPDGDLSEVKHQNVHWKKQPDGKSWVNDRGELWKGKIDVTMGGDLRFIDEHRKLVVHYRDGVVYTQYPNGERVHEFNNGLKIREYRDPEKSIVEYDKHGRVTYVSDESRPILPRKERKFYYNDKTGDLEGIKGIDGQMWRKTQDGHWQSERGKIWKGNISVDDAGVIHYQSDRGGRFVLTRQGEIHPEGHPERKHRARSSGEAPPGGGGGGGELHTLLRSRTGQDALALEVAEALRQRQSGESLRREVALQDGVTGLGVKLLKAETGDEALKIIDGLQKAAVADPKGQAADYLARLESELKERGMNLVGLKDHLKSVAGEPLSEDLKGDFRKGLTFQVEVDIRREVQQLGKEFVRAQGPIDTAQALENLLEAGKTNRFVAGMLKELGIDVENKKQVEQIKETLAKARDGEGDIDAIKQLAELQAKLLPILDKQARELAQVVARDLSDKGQRSYELVSQPGVRRTENADGSIVDINADGKVTRIQDAKGRVFGFVYGPDGKLSEVTNVDGHWKKQPDGKTWVNDQGERWKGTVEVTADGHYRFTSDSGMKVWYKANGDVCREYPNGQKVTEFKDGYKVKEYPKPDKSIVEFDEKGRVTYVSDGGMPPKEREFYYDKKTGELTGIKGIDGQMWTKTGEGEWKSDRGKVWKGQLRLDNDGVIHYQKEGGVRFLLNRAGIIHAEGHPERPHVPKSVRDRDREADGAGSHARRHRAAEGEGAPAPEKGHSAGENLKKLLSNRKKRGSGLKTDSQQNWKLSSRL